MTNAMLIARALQQAGLRFVFGVPGGEVVELIEAIENVGLEFILMGHESAAALAAGTQGMATGVPGACLATLGPGAANLVLGVGEALLERHPLLAISARTAQSQEDLFSHQSLDLNAIFAPISKAAFALDGKRTQEKVRQALDLARKPPCGPVFLSLPGDIAALAGDPGEQKSIPPYPARKITLGPLLEKLNGASHPLAVSGIALDQAGDGGAIRSFLAQTGIPFMDTPKTKGLLDIEHELYLGTCLSASGDSILADLIRRSDCILGIGFDPVESAYDWHLSDHFYNLANYSTAYKSFRPNMEVVARVGLLLDDLAAGYSGRPAWTREEILGIKNAVHAAVKPDKESTAAGLSPYHAALEMQRILPPETRISLDTGQHKMLICQAWQTDRPLSFFCSNGLSSMGTGVPGAIALALDNPARPAVCVAGDGGFGMMVQELETIRRLAIHPLIVVFCDQALSLIRIPQQMRAYASRGIDMAHVDWAKVAEGFGIQGQWAHSMEDLRSALIRWVAHPEAAVLAVQIDEGLYRGNNY